MLRKKIVAGNWKMNNDIHETNGLIKDLLNESNSTNCQVMIAPVSYTHLTLPTRIRV